MIEITQLIEELMPVLRDIISMRANNIEELESRLRDLTVEIGNRVMRFKLERMDKELSDSSSSNLCKCTQGAVVHREKRGRQILTTYGKVEIRRTMSRCVRCGQRRFVLDEFIGLERYKRVSPMLRELALLCGASWSYQKASVVLSELLGVEDVITAKQIEKLSRGETQEVMEKEEIEHEQIMDSVMLDYREIVPERIYYVDVDGGMVNSRDDNNKQSQRMEGKVVAIWGKKISVKSRKEIVDKFYSGTFNSYKQLVEGVNDQLWSRCGSRRQEVEIVLRGDGANWIRQMRKDYFHRALYILDWYHLAKKITERLEQAAQDDGQREGIDKELKDLVYEGKVQEAVVKLEELKAKVRVEGQEAIEKLIGYIKRNKEGMWYKEARERGIVIGTGTAEKAVDLVICRRFKQRGMRWTRDGANALVKIRLLILNDKWNQYWDSKLAA
jgi:Uncharacterised protein family (UPF0236).